MKKLFLFISVLITGSALLLSSCKEDYLDKDPLGALKTEDMQDSTGAASLLIGAYGALDGVGVGAANPWEAAPSNWIYGSVAGGDASKGSFGGDQPGIDPIVNFYADASNGFFNSKWRACFEGVTRCNATITALAKATDISPADAANIQAQARFLRGHYYFELKKMFNKVPWIDETTTVFTQPNTEDIWPKIEADFKFAYENLPPTQKDLARANKWAAGAYLAKAYLYQHKYQEAKPMFDAVINQGVTTNGLKYGLRPALTDNFLPSLESVNQEAVFSVQMAARAVAGNIDNANSGEMLNFPYNSPFGCCGFFQPSQELVNHYRTNSSTGLPYLDTYNEHPVKSDQGIASNVAFTPDAGTLDPRLDWTVGRRGIPFHDWGNHPGQAWVREQSYGGAYAAKKNIYWKKNIDTDYDNGSWAPGTSINVHIIRFADVLLMASEVEAQMGNLDKAQEYVNMVRNRAADPANILYKYKNDAKPEEGFSTTPAANYLVSPYPAGYFATAGKNGALKAIYYERKIELALEGHRFFDLVRWGIAEEELNRYFAYQGKITQDVRNGKFVSGKNEYYPIPQRQIDLSVVNGKPTLTQNEKY
ncbi:RagB/SusD family nutrient uptake outer membrane protein [Arcticibacter sp. MXS-1]|uniref:RagB/SusD family nutrient uptake outer membrane protein n=1 Tax=Arcticibacter sp. MXS-1 TaxID=3341726 RepID=UPI0035A930F0